MKPNSFIVWTRADCSVCGILLPFLVGVRSGVSAAAPAAGTVHLQGHLAFRLCITVPAHLPLLATLHFLNSLITNDFNKNPKNYKITSSVFPDTRAFRLHPHLSSTVEPKTQQCTGKSNNS